MPYDEINYGAMLRAKIATMTKEQRLQMIARCDMYLREMENLCSHCGKQAVEFTDELSRREFGISGLCQQCQDEVFKED